MWQFYSKLKNMVAEQTQFGADSALAFVLASFRKGAAACSAGLDHPL
jgi:hypothetical protein